MSHHIMNDLPSGCTDHESDPRTDRRTCFYHAGTAGLSNAAMNIHASRSLSRWRGIQHTRCKQQKPHRVRGILTVFDEAVSLGQCIGNILSGSVLDRQEFVSTVTCETTGAVSHIDGQIQDLEQPACLIPRFVVSCRMLRRTNKPANEPADELVQFSSPVTLRMWVIFSSCICSVVSAHR